MAKNRYYFLLLTLFCCLKAQYIPSPIPSQKVMKNLSAETISIDSKEKILSSMKAIHKGLSNYPCKNHAELVGLLSNFDQISKRFNISQYTSEIVPELFDRLDPANTIDALKTNNELTQEYLRKCLHFVLNANKTNLY